jgi:hypothetical protein
MTRPSMRKWKRVLLIVLFVLRRPSRRARPPTVLRYCIDRAALKHVPDGEEPASDR